MDNIDFIWVLNNILKFCFTFPVSLLLCGSRLLGPVRALCMNRNMEPSAWDMFSLANISPLKNLILLLSAAIHAQQILDVGGISLAPSPALLKF